MHGGLHGIAFQIAWTEGVGQPALTSGSAADAAARDARLDPKLVSAAHEFEASLMEELLRPLNSRSFFGEDDGNDAGSDADLAGLTSSADGSGSALMSFGSEALARALSLEGGLGIARRVLDHFEALPGKAEAAEMEKLTPAGRGLGTRSKLITKVTECRADELREGENVL
jgi:hypothetical protein